MEIKTSKYYHHTEQREKEEAMDTHIEDTQRLVTEVSLTTYRKQNLPESYKALEKEGFHFTNYSGR